MFYCCLTYFWGPRGKEKEAFHQRNIVRQSSFNTSKFTGSRLEHSWLEPLQTGPWRCRIRWVDQAHDDPDFCWPGLGVHQGLHYLWHSCFYIFLVFVILSKCLSLARSSNENGMCCSKFTVTCIYLTSATERYHTYLVLEDQRNTNFFKLVSATLNLTTWMEQLHSIHNLEK